MMTRSSVGGCGGGRGARVGGVGGSVSSGGGGGGGRLPYDQRKPGNVEYKLKHRKLLFSLRKNFNDWAFGVAMVGVLLMILDLELIMSEVGKVDGKEIEFSTVSLTLR